MLHPPASKARSPAHRPGHFPAAVLLGACLLPAAACTSNEGRRATPSGTGVPAGTTGTTGPIAAPQPLSPFLVVDQFGYRPVSEKIAVIRSPKQGFDSGTTFTPGATYALVDVHTSQKVLEGAPAAWHDGAVDGSSGDLAWWFDFSKVTTPGDYFVLDETQAVRSDVFTISETVYRDVLTQAMRMLYYQRDGLAKDAQHAGAAYVDGAAHMGRCHLYSDASKTPDRDLHGGWWDAGDFNKYTSQGAEYVIELLRAYEDTPAAFRDDYNIPESGNGVPDVLDEVKWELDWLTRMQSADGSVLCIVEEPAAKSPRLGGSPDTSPSRVTDPCFYGPATTAASYATAAAFAYAARIFGSAPGASVAYPGFAGDLTERAKQAWTWAQAHSGVSAVYFHNSQNGFSAGEQEVGADGLPFKQLEAALYLFQLTGDAAYRSAFDGSHAGLQLIRSGSADAYHGAEQEVLLAYAQTPGATPAVAQQIKAAFKSAAQSGDNLGSVQKNLDPYLAYLVSYTWGSNQVKADQGNLFYDLVTYAVDPANPDAIRGAERYIHYIHGVNPLGLVYLSSMGEHGAVKSVTRFFHSWFGEGSNWDAVGVSKYGPPPGYLVGGPNPGYTWNRCCLSRCGRFGRFDCGAAPPSPPTGQPAQKSYKDFNANWPLDSWSISEPDDGYQAKYVRLLSKFVK